MLSRAQSGNPDEFGLARESFPTAITFDENALQSDRYAGMRTPIRAIAFDSNKFGIADDALSFRFQGDQFVVGVNVAHATARIGLDSALEHAIIRHARNYYNGVYCTEPMLPMSIARQHLGLQVQESRPTLSCEITFNSKLKFSSYRFFLSHTTLDLRCNFKDIATVFTEGERVDEFQAAFEAARNLAELRQALGGQGQRLFDRTAIEAITPQALLRDPIAASFMLEEMILAYNYLAGRKNRDADRDALFRRCSLADSKNLNRLSVTPVEHASLGLDHYLRATSPLRSAEDFVNQRILTATICNEPMPYSQTRLFEIATQLESKDRAHSSQVWSIAHGRELTPKEMRDLEADYFSDYLKSCIQTQNFLPALATETFHRLNQQRLTFGDVYNIIMGTQHLNGEWRDIRLGAIETFFRSPNVAANLMQRAARERPAALLQIEIVSSPQHSADFEVRSRYFEANKVIESRWISAQSIRYGASRSALAIFAEIAANRWKDASEQQVVNFETLKSSEVIGNSVPLIAGDLFQKFINQLENPKVKHTISYFNIPHGAFYEVVVSVLDGQREYLSQAYRARNSNRAQRAAEYDILLKYAPDLLAQYNLGAIENNPIQLLQMDCERAKIPLPIYRQELKLPQNSRDIIIEMHGAIEVEPKRYLYVGPVVLENIGAAKLEVAIKLREKLKEYWNGASVNLVGAEIAYPKYFNTLMAIERREQRRRRKQQHE